MFVFLEREGNQWILELRRSKNSKMLPIVTPLDYKLLDFISNESRIYPTRWVLQMQLQTNVRLVKRSYSSRRKVRLNIRKLGFQTTGAGWVFIIWYASRVSHIERRYFECLGKDSRAYQEKLNFVPLPGYDRIIFLAFNDASYLQW